MSQEAMRLACKALRDCHYYMINAGLPNQSLLNEAFTAYMELEAALAEQPAPATKLREQEPVAVVSGYYGGQCVILPIDPARIFNSNTALYTSPPAQRPHECSRSHPHENMDAMCELRTEIARLTNENARLKAQPQQEPFGYLYEGTAEHTRHKTVFEKTRAERFETRWWREIGPCYTFPPAQRTWVGLTDEERIMCRSYDPEEAVAKTEAKLKEKNT